MLVLPRGRPTGFHLPVQHARQIAEEAFGKKPLAPHTPLAVGRVCFLATKPIEETLAASRVRLLTSTARRRPCAITKTRCDVTQLRSRMFLAFSSSFIIKV